ASAGASDGVITNIAFVINGVRLASGNNSPFGFNWTSTQAGGYSIVAVATDNSGLTATSNPANIDVINIETPPPTVSTAPLVLQIAGLGTVSPNLNGAQLQVGKTYTLHAKPGAGQVFAGWSGIASQSPALTFVMQPSLTLAASFVPNPFLPVKG